MSFAFLPFYTGDYLRDTRHLTPMRHGVYIMLLFHCWDQKGPIPLDEQECAGIANCRSHDEVDALRYVLERFFIRMEDGWYNKRMQREIERAHAIGLKRKIAGAKGFQAKAKHLLSKRQAKAKQVPLQPQPQLQPELQKEKSTTLFGEAPNVSARDVKTQAREVLAFLNEKAGRRYQPVPENLNLIEARLKSGATIEELRAVVAKKCREWIGDAKMSQFLRPKTLFNATNFANYQGELRAVS